MDYETFLTVQINSVHFHRNGTIPFASEKGAVQGQIQKKGGGGPESTMKRMHSKNAQH